MMPAKVGVQKMVNDANVGADRYIGDPGRCRLYKIRRKVW